MKPRPPGHGQWLALSSCMAVLLLFAWFSPVAAMQEPLPPEPGDTVAEETERRAADTVDVRGVPDDTVGVTEDEEPAADVPGAPEDDEPTDEILQELLGLEGYSAIEYGGDRAEFRAADRTIRLYGSPDIVRGQERIEARDTIVYRDAEQLVDVFGSPRVSGMQGDDIEGDRMQYDLNRRRARVVGGSTQLSERGGTWYVRGEDIAAETGDGAERVYVARSTYTSDDRPEPQYHFQSDRVLVIQDRILVGRPARLYFRNVPVAWFPFLVQDLSEGRRSGLLTPSFGITDIVRTSSAPAGRAGTGRRISNLGLYWAASDYFDAQVATDWHSGISTGMEGRGNYRWRRQFLNGNFTFRQDWRDDAPNVFSLRTSNNWEPTERTRMTLQGNYTSSSGFIRATTVDPSEGTRDLTSNASLNHRFNWGSVSVAGERRQSVADESVRMTLPNITINPNSITLFRPSSPAQASWYNNATLNLNASGSRRTRDAGLRLSPNVRDEAELQGRASSSLTLGNLSWNTSGDFNRTERGAFPGSETPGDTVAPIPAGPAEDDATLNTSLGYQINLIGSTRLTPNVGLQQRLRTDTLFGGFASAPVRTNFGARLATELFGFFPGFGSFDAIRHRMSPSISYTYAPEARQTPTQERVFGAAGGRTRNRIQFDLSHTFEARIGGNDNGNGEPADTTTEAGDAPAAGGGQSQARTVSLLSVNTSALAYDFAKAADGEPGFDTRTVNTTLSSQYLRGFRVNFTHELFDRTGEVPTGELGVFAPRLQRLNTGIQFGRDTGVVQAILGVLGLRQAAVPEGEERLPGEETDVDDPDMMGQDDDMLGMGDRLGRDAAAPNAMDRPRATGGPWRVRLDYAFSRPSRQGAVVSGRESQDVRANISFAPTANWAVDWNTTYSLSDGEFGEHRLSLRRDLYRWQADFSFTRTIYGNSMFSVSVNLIDLPDLRVDHRERNIGAEGTGFLGGDPVPPDDPDDPGPEDPPFPDDLP